MIQLFKAVDSMDGVMSYFVFDTKDTGKYIAGTYSTAMLCFGSDQALEEAVIEMVKVNDWCAFNDHDRKDSMVNPVLIAEW